MAYKDPAQKKAYMGRWNAEHPDRPRGDHHAWSVRNPERLAFLNAKDRCQNPRNAHYRHYGGRGIEFRFESYAEFFSAIGPRPDGLTLDRIDNDGHYEPGNVRWVSHSVNIRNRTRR